jgi:hypothetical protein
MTIQVCFTLRRDNGSKKDLIYRAFDNEHSKIWLDGIRDFCSSGLLLDDRDRVYNLQDYQTAIQRSIDNCNKTITDLNKVHSLSIPWVHLETFQTDINNIHSYFVEYGRRVANIDTTRWGELNHQLHGIEIIERSKHKNKQGQIFIDWPNKQLYNMPTSALDYFTTKKVFGYCYANYPHLGRHLYEMFLANDSELHNNDDFVPMSKISGCSYLWFGNTTPWVYVTKHRYQIWKWFHKNKIDQVVGMEWKDPKLAIGWLPVAKITQSVKRIDLLGFTKVDSISII